MEFKVPVIQTQAGIWQLQYDLILRSICQRTCT